MGRLIVANEGVPYGS
jgi:hypothetical protein